MSNATLSTPNIPWLTRFLTFIIHLVTDLSRRPNGTINRFLLNYLDLKVSANHNPVNNVASSDLTIDPSRNLWCRLFHPTTTGSLPVVVYFHGGGFSFCSIASRNYDVYLRRLARRIPAVVVAVEYRLAPEHPYPAQYDDGFDTLKFIDNNVHTILPPNADLSKCFVAGDSAGANLAHHVALRTCEEKFNTLKLIGLISIQPFFGGEERTESEIRITGVPLVSVERTDWMWQVFLPKGSDRDHPAANVSGPNAVDISGVEEFPETVVVVAGFDPLQDWQRRYYQWLKKSGKVVNLIEYPTMFHAFYVFPEVPESSLLIRNVKDFVAKCCNKL